ncbi:RNA polymerase sigma factor [Dietzia natronolimnaea]|uniref:RNA polymerase sigma factor n=1 Tax=Dietzia natronolimnaea TaxID=161920 RepID=UPI0015952A0A|nr:RNA polymerase sigma factor [Dietzia natronolimnaea]
MRRREDDAVVRAPSTHFDVDTAYLEHGRSIYGFARSSVGDRALAEECVHDVFVRAWRARHSYDPTRSTQRTWLFSIARNVVIDAVRARARRAEPVHDVPEPATTRQSDTSRLVDRIDLQAALAQISREHREVIIAVQVDGMTYHQLSERTGVSVGTLRSRMYYGLRSVREIMEAEEQR